MASKGLVRVRAEGIVFGYLAGEGSQHTSAVVPPGTLGSLLDLGVDGYTVAWDRAFRADPKEGVALEALDGAEVTSDFAAHQIIRPANIGFVEVVEVEQDGYEIDRTSGDVVKTDGPHLAQFACEVMDAVDRLAAGGGRLTAEITDDLADEDVEAALDDPMDGGEDQAMDSREFVARAMRVMDRLAAEIGAFAETFGDFAEELQGLDEEAHDEV